MQSLNMTVFTAEDKIASVKLEIISSYQRVQQNKFFISGFRSDIDSTCSLLGCYAASNGNLLMTFWDNVSVQSSRVKTSKKKRDVGKGLPLDAA
jgi:hypothetical protein